MRVRILRSIASIHGSYKAGAVAEVPPEVARRWIQAGAAMEDKAIEPSETK